MLGRAWGLLDKGVGCGCPVAGSDFWPKELFKYVLGSGVGMPYTGMKSLGTFCDTIISTVYFFVVVFLNNWKHLLIILFIFNSRIFRVREVRFISRLYFLEFNTVWRRDKWITK